jgi:hypothetical protein
MKKASKSTNPPAAPLDRSAARELIDAADLMQQAEAVQRELLLSAASLPDAVRVGDLADTELQSAKRKFLHGAVRTSRSSGADNDRVYTVVVPEADGRTFHFAYFLTPDRHTVGQCIGKNAIQQATILANDCRFAGSPAVVERDDLFVALSLQLPRILELRTAALHDGFFDPASRSAGYNKSTPSSDTTSTSTPPPSPTTS